MAAQPPFLLGKYMCERDLGGNMAEVYLARDIKMDRKVVVKLLREEDAENADVRMRFMSEARTACRCSHPNIITTYDSDEINGRPYIVMEFLEGESLRKMMDRGALGSQEQAVGIAIQVARALEYVHQQHIVHRDLKPANIHMNPDGRAKLIDFGIARIDDLHLTKTGQIIGSPKYMSPEQVKGGTIGARSDIYSFGVLFFEMLTGKPPYDAPSNEEYFARILFAQPELDALPAHGVADGLTRLITSCMDKDPENRPASFTEVTAALRPFAPKWIGEEDATLHQGRREPTGQRLREPIPDAVQVPVKSRSWIPAVAIAAILLASAAIGYVLLKPDPKLDPVIQAKGGEMVLVPAGKAKLGKNRVERNVPGFYIDKTEVSVRDYLAFCAETGRTRPPGIEALDPDQPVGNVTLEDAQRFAAWAGKRLPTDSEWEKAARGENGFLLPWGNEPKPGAANLSASAEEVKQRRAQAVYALPEGASPYGALNMLGNVWEWVDTAGALEDADVQHWQQLLPSITPPFNKTEAAWQVRGASWNMVIPPSEAGQILADFMLAPVRVRMPDIGFRCAKDLPAKK